VAAIALATASLTKTFLPRVRALVDVTLAIPEGRVVALVGPNGAGKSTLIRCWAGFERPSRGTATVLGVNPERAHGQTALVPQQPALYRSLTVGDHIGLAAHARPSFAASVVMDRLRKVGVESQRKVGDLSGGQRSQLALSLAIGVGAKVVLLDEPVASLDPLARQEFLQELGSIAAEGGRTVLLSSHIVSDIAKVCDWLIVLAGGRVLLSDDLNDVVARHVVARAAVAGSRAVGLTITDGPDNVVLELKERQLLPPPVTRPATLEDVVLAYLSASR
jgi:ABC-2 type transport system ATP-binding protein